MNTGNIIDARPHLLFEMVRSMVRNDPAAAGMRPRSPHAARSVLDGGCLQQPSADPRWLGALDRTARAANHSSQRVLASAKMIACASRASSSGHGGC
jgi:hypothetical protein